jgi:hypothetical protein
MSAASLLIPEIVLRTDKTGRIALPTSVVNLDALITRQDFTVVPQRQNETRTGPPSQIGETHLRRAEFFYSTLRKPDFQRETANWKPSQIADFIETFVNQDLIPAVIMWQDPNGATNFVIDGAHRLSAVIAWINNDYGDEFLSRDLFGPDIEPEQISAARKTRSLVEKQVGRYSDLKKALEHEDTAPPELVRKAKQLAAASIQLQWITGSADNAGKSFIRINQRAVPIDPTELQIIENRSKPNAIAARAVVRRGTGHKFWKEFGQDKQDEIEKLGKQIYNILYTPTLDVPIQTLDLPFAGRGYSGQTLPLMFTFLNMVNEVTVGKDGKGKKDGKEIIDDKEGTETVSYLKKALRVAQILFSKEPLSVGLHPAVYCYGASGRFQPTAFLGIVNLIHSFEQEGKQNYLRFTEHRGAFEEFLLRNRGLSNQIATTIGSGSKGYPHLVVLYKIVLNCFISGIKDDAKILAEIKKEPKLSYIATDETALKRNYNKGFTKGARSAVYLKEALEKALTCPRCNARKHKNAMVLDHIQGKATGGVGDPENGQYVHPYCNSIKN